MGFTVQHQGGMKDSDYKTYLLLVSRYLYKQGAYLDSVPRVPAGDNGHGWLYVWDDEAEAAAFAKQLTKETRDRGWCVQAVKGKPSVGPIRALEMAVSRWDDNWVFHFGPFTEYMLRKRFPDCRLLNHISIYFEKEDDLLSPPGKLRHFVKQILLMLTGLSAEQLLPFGCLRLIDPVEDTDVIPPIPLAEINVEELATASRRSCT